MKYLFNPFFFVKNIWRITKLSILGLLLSLGFSQDKLFAGSGFGRSQIGTSGGQFLKLGVNARAIGMGEAYSTVADGSDALYWNPAGLVRVENKAASFLHASYIGDIFYDYVSYAHRIKSLGVLAASFQYLGAENIDRRNEFGVTTGDFDPRDLAFTLGWAKKFKGLDDGEFSFGFAAKLVQSKIINTATAGAIDFGLNYSPLPKLNLGAAVQNLGSELKFVEDGDDLPLNIKLGSSYQILKPWIVALDINFPRDNRSNVSLGSEYKFPIARELLMAGRIGYSSRNTSDLEGVSSVSIGLGMEWKRKYGLDFAWVPFGDLGNTFRVSASVKFK